MERSRACSCLHPSDPVGVELNNPRRIRVRRQSASQSWELAAVNAPVINEHPASQVRVAGETATFRVGATGHGFVAFQWYFQSDLIVGVQSDMLTIPNVREQNAGEYHVRVGSACGSVTSRVATLTFDRKLQIFSSPGALSPLWSPATNGNNAFLESAMT